MVALTVKDIKKAQKESVLLHEVASLFLKASLDDNRLKELVVNRVKLSADKKYCTIYFYTNKGINYFEETSLDALKLYKPSLRKAIAQNVPGRYVPDFIFRFDEEFEKQQQVNELIDRLKKEGKL